MPEITAFIDKLREAFGAEMINEQIRKGMRGEPYCFYATENGHEVGTKFPKGNAVTWNPVTGNAINVENDDDRMG